MKTKLEAATKSCFKKMFKFSLKFCRSYMKDHIFYQGLGNTAARC